MTNDASQNQILGSLPVELAHGVARHLPEDSDITNLRLVSRPTAHAIDADGGSVWVPRYRRTFDYNANVALNSAQVKTDYQGRFWVLHHEYHHDFDWGSAKEERRVLVVLRELITESFLSGAQVDETGLLYCRNHEYLKEYIMRSKILFRDRCPPAPRSGAQINVDHLLAVIKLTCAAFMFVIENLPQEVYGFAASQQAVYATSSTMPLFTGSRKLKINTDWMLDSLNFFCKHMLCPEHDTLFDTIQELPASQKPSLWRQPLQYGTQVLNRRWKGTFSYLRGNNYELIRSITPDDPFSPDINDHHVKEGYIEDLTFNFDISDEDKKWPATFERHLESHRNPRPGEDLQFVAKLTDVGAKFTARGWLTALPLQSGIPGFMRITFVRHIDNEDLDADASSDHNLYGYEGIVTPGGRMILGRWWLIGDPHETNGPFIFWAVD